jgi:DNA-binding response OmpR family regulator
MITCAPDDGPPTVRSSARPGTVPEMSLGVRILVVEDDPAVAESLVEGIGREGYQVHHEGTAAGAVAYARSHRPQLVVLDVRLPDGSGFDVCREMRQSGLRSPILMLTVQSDEIDQVLGLEMGADDYVAKPYRLRELLARIRALLRRAYGELASADADLLYAGDLVIDRSSAQVTRADRRIDLTPTEFKLLSFLAQHPGQVFSRGQLLQNVWGYSAELFDEKTVNVHVRRLRSKIEVDPAEPTIVLTVPGLGYRLAT